MGILDKRKKAAKPAAGAGTMETALGSTELHVNPPPDVSLARMEARLGRINLSLSSGKWPEGSSKEMELQTAKRRLEALIKMRKGEF
jgi:hypothetical protein